MKTCLFLLCFVFGFWFGRIYKPLKKSKFLILACLFVLIVARETMAAELYNLDGTYNFYDSSSNTYEYSMPTQRFYPGNDYSDPVIQNVTLGATSYQLRQTVDTSGDLDNSTVLGSTVISGTRQGWLSGYKQTFKYVNTVEDKYQLHFNINQRRGGSGQAKLYYYTDNGWVLAYTDTIDGTTYSSGDVETAFNVKGWMVEIDYTLNSGFAFLRADDQYSDGYRLNDFYFGIKDSQEVAEEVQDKIEKNTRETNGLLGTIQNKIDSVINTVTGIPQAIADKLEELFVPTDFYYTLESGAEDIIDSLGVLGYPLDFYVKTMQICRDVDTQSMPVEIPAIYYNGHTIFPRYYRSDIFYFRDMPVFTNVQKTTWIRQLMGSVGIDMDTVTIGQFVKKIMNIVLFFGLVRFFAFIFDCIFGTDVEEVVDDDD